VTATDAGGLSYAKTFTVTVNNVSGSFVGDNNVNNLVGTSEEDTIQGLGANDTLQGLAGDDILNGGTGSDRAVYSDATGGITVHMAAGTVSGAGVGSDTLIGIELITGSDHDDTYNAVDYIGADIPELRSGSMNSRAWPATTPSPATERPASPMSAPPVA
jgi:Ca2+-binding RTX toxin-like protein